MCSYPGCCVLQYPPIIYKCKDPVAICMAFVDCLHTRLPTLCGYPINYTTRLLQPDVGLTTALHCRTFANLLHVGNKPASGGTACKAADCNSAVSHSHGVVKSNHLYKPIFHSSSVSRTSERRPATAVNHSPACTSNSSSSSCQIVPSTITSIAVLSKITSHCSKVYIMNYQNVTSDGYIVQDDSSGYSGMLCDDNIISSSLIMQVSNCYGIFYNVMHSYS